ncbi:MAG TPA: NAD-binding protein, partial [Planctomycetaceae bacterium]|nr:NAD-binding protein [Planctomycetaceae bacterium]
MPDTDERSESSDTRSSEFREHWVSTLLFLLTVLTVSFGFNGFRQQHIELVAQGNPPEIDWTIPVYRTVQLLMLNSGAEDPDNASLAVARMLAACTFLVLTAAVVRKVFHESTQLPKRLTRTGHTVICGLGNVGTQLLDDLCRLGRQRRIVVIEQDETNMGLDRARRAGVDVVIGDATRAETLRRARAHCAETVFAVSGDDGANLELASELDQILSRRPEVRRRRGRSIPLRLVMHLHDVKLAHAFQRLSQSSPSADVLDVSIFSVARTSATHVVTKALWSFAPQSRNEVAHFVILGFGPMGRALAVTLARLGHFPNGKRSRFTIADRDLPQHARDFLSRFPRFTAWSDTSVGVSRFDAERDQWSSRVETVPTLLASESPDAIDYVANAQFRELPPDLGDELFCRELLDSFVDPQ